MSTAITFLPLLIVLIIGVYVFVRLRRGVSHEAAGPQGQMPYGSNGWLAFLISVMYFLAPMYGVSTLTNALNDSEQQFPGLLEVDGYGTYKVCVWLLLGVTIAVQWRAAWLLRNRWVPSSVRFAKFVVFLAPLVVPIVDLILASLTIAAPDVADVAASALAAAKGVVSGTIWLAYLHFSKRVRNTYFPVPLVVPSGTNKQNSVEVEPIEKRDTSASSSIAQASALDPVSASTVIEEKMSTLKRLLDEGLISDSDYALKKQELLQAF